MAIFSMVKAVLWTDWRFVDAGRIAVIWHARPNVPGNVGMSPSDFASYQSSLRTFEQVAAVTTRGFNLGGAGSPSRVTCARMTASMFPMLGVSPALGRWFTAEEERDNARVIVISHGLWMSEMGGNPAAIGRDIILDAIPRRIVAVMPDRFVFPPEGVQGLAPAACWVPASYTPAELAIPSFNHVVMGRLAKGIRWEQAAADAHAGAQRIWSTYPAAVQSQLQLTARVVPLAEQATSRARTPLALFAGTVIALLLIGCANASSLMLTSFDARRHEMAIRMSMGASRLSLMTQVLIESVGLALAGGVFGAVIAEGLLSAMIAANAAAFPRLADARFDMTALVVATACALVAGLISGFAPAHAAGGQRAPGERTRVMARGVAGTMWRQGVIAFELALAVVVVILAGVLTRSVLSLNRVDVGIDAAEAFTFTVALPEARYQSLTRIAAFQDGVVDSLNRLPGIRSVAVSSALPIGEVIPGVVSSVGSASPADYRPVAAYAVTEHFANTLGIAITSGRFFERADQRVAVVNESLARQLSPHGTIVGRDVMMVGQTKPIKVIGVMADVRQGGSSRPAAPAIYQPLWQAELPIRTLHFIARADMPISRISGEIRRAVGSVDPEIPVFALRTVSESIAATTAVQRFNVLVVGIFAVFAISLAVSGLYAVIAHAVQQARRDFGIRQALGATRARILRSIVAQALWPAGAGIVAGVGVALAATELIASQLFGVESNDTLTLVAAVLLILCASAASVLVPAVRASRADPAMLLRSE